MGKMESLGCSVSVVYLHWYVSILPMVYIGLVYYRLERHSRVQSLLLELRRKCVGGSRK
jgi:hypothetical protein